MKFEMLFIAVYYVLAMQLNCKPIMPLFIQFSKLQHNTVAACLSPIILWCAKYIISSNTDHTVFIDNDRHLPATVQLCICAPPLQYGKPEFDNRAKPRPTTQHSQSCIYAAYT